MTTILLVDDSKTLREVFKVYLMGKGWEIVEASAAKRAMQLLQLLPVDVLVVDMNLPDTNGLDFTRSVRAHADPRVRAIPIIVITGDKSADARLRSEEAGADAFLQKPLDSERVTAAVDSLLAARPR
jgi:two-component system, chemotaxis family, chemotaxis protein CheY